MGTATGALQRDQRTGADVSEQDHLRVGHAEREAVVRQLNEAFSEGRLDIGELEERVSQAYAAKTLGDLRPLTADLPASSQTPQPSNGGAPASDGHQASPGPSPVDRSGWVPYAGRWDRGETALWRGAVVSWLSASLVNLMIWAAVSGSGGHWVYPWWIWVAGPWGAVLLAGEVARRIGR